MEGEEGWESRRNRRRMGFLIGECGISWLVALSAQHPHPAGVVQAAQGSGDIRAQPSVLVERSWRRTGMVHLPEVRDSALPCQSC